MRGYVDIEPDEVAAWAIVYRNRDQESGKVFDAVTVNGKKDDIADYPEQVGKQKELGTNGSISML